METCALTHGSMRGVLSRHYGSIKDYHNLNHQFSVHSQLWFLERIFTNLTWANFWVWNCSVRGTWAKHQFWKVCSTCPMLPLGMLDKKICPFPIGSFGLFWDFNKFLVTYIWLRLQFSTCLCKDFIRHSRIQIYFINYSPRYTLNSTTWSIRSKLMSKFKMFQKNAVCTQNYEITNFEI